MNQTSICILDFKKPLESKLLLESIQKFCKFEKEVIFVCNGATEDYAYEYYKDGLIDKLVLNKENFGGGFSTVQAIYNSFNDWILWIENDSEFITEITQEYIDYYIDSLKNGRFSAIDLTGGICNGEYSGRAFLINREFYNSIDKYALIDGKKVYSGPGCPNGENVKYLEGYIQDYFRINNLKVGIVQGLIKDNGKYSIRQSGKYNESLLIHRPDTKEVWVIKPYKEKCDSYIPFTNEEFDDIINGNWPVWGKDKIGRKPKNWENLSFIHW